MSGTAGSLGMARSIRSPGVPGAGRGLLLLALLAAPGPFAVLAGCGDDGAARDDAGEAVDGDADGEAGEGHADVAEVEDVAEAADEALAPVSVTPVADTVPAADPKLPGFDGWPLAFVVDSGGRTGLRCRVDLSRIAGALATFDVAVSGGRCAVLWDAHATDGAWLAPGPLTATVQVLAAATDDVLAEASDTLEIVRLGIDRIELTSGAVGKRVDLLWAEMGGVADGFYEATRDTAPWSLDRDASDPAEAVDLDLADGSPRALPDVWADLKTPPTDAASPDGVEHDTFDLPTAWVAGSLLDVAARLSADVAGAPGGGAPTAMEVRVLAPDGTRLVGNAAFVPGGTVTVRASTSPVPAVGRYDWSLAWRFEARRPGGGWLPVPGSLTTLHRLYGVVGVPSFNAADVPHRAWVEVLDTIAGWVDGATADPREVAGHIVDGIYNTLGLRYDDVSGASAYTDYTDGWNGGEFYIVAFQRRDYGSTINCSDAAGIVGAYANMVGIDMGYHIIEHAWDTGFDLNFIQPIGFTTFSETPFRGGGGSFSYHAVAGPSDGTVFDATLALDGDGTPTALPCTALLAEGLDPDEYLFDLSSQYADVIIHIDDKVTLR